MIAKTYILENLGQLNSRFLRTSKPKDGIYFSKLAVLELCGWIEMSMDDIVLRTCQKRLSDPRNLKYVEKDVIARTYGFQYQLHWRNMLIRTLGIVRVEKIERAVNQQKRVNLESELGNLATIRNSLAHTYVRGTQVQIDAPSVTMDRFTHLHDGLKEFERVISNTP